MDNNSEKLVLLQPYLTFRLYTQKDLGDVEIWFQNA